MRAVKMRVAASIDPYIDPAARRLDPRALAAIALAAALALALPGVAGAQTAKRTLTVRAIPLAVTFGQPSTLFGVLTGRRPGSTVAIAQDPFPYGGGYQALTTTTTAANGSFRVLLLPQFNVNYRVRAGGLTRFTGNRVRTKVTLTAGDTTPARGQLVRFSGFVAPRHDGGTVLLQRRTPSGFWAVVARVAAQPVATGNRSRFTRVLKVGAGLGSVGAGIGIGSYRARVLSDGDHLTGTSTRVALRVRR
jgi:hypothetical protein